MYKRFIQLTPSWQCSIGFRKLHPHIRSYRSIPVIYPCPVGTQSLSDTIELELMANFALRFSDRSFGSFLPQVSGLQTDIYHHLGESDFPCTQLLGRYSRLEVSLHDMSSMVGL